MNLSKKRSQQRFERLKKKGAGMDLSALFFQRLSKERVIIDELNRANGRGLRAKYEFTICPITGGTKVWKYITNDDLVLLGIIKYYKYIKQIDKLVNEGALIPKRNVDHVRKHTRKYNFIFSEETAMAEEKEAGRLRSWLGSFFS